MIDRTPSHALSLWLDKSVWNVHTYIEYVFMPNGYEE
jgi:hypothetical protein